MEIRDKKSEEVVSFFKALDEMLEAVRQALQSRTPALNGEKYLTNRDVSELLHISSRTLQEYTAPVLALQ